MMTHDKRRIDDALTHLADQAKAARVQWLKELAACREQGLTGKPGSPFPPSLTERFAHWAMAHAMLYTAVAYLKNGGQRDARTDTLTNDLIANAWPKDTRADYDRAAEIATRLWEETADARHP
jgi:hypothetical protein